MDKITITKEDLDMTGVERIPTQEEYKTFMKACKKRDTKTFLKLIGEIVDDEKDIPKDKDLDQAMMIISLIHKIISYSKYLGIRKLIMKLIEKFVASDAGSDDEAKGIYFILGYYYNSNYKNFIEIV